MKKLLTAKKFWIIIVALLLVAGWWFGNQSSSTLPVGVETGVVERGQVLEVVSETGTVDAGESVDLAFERGGRIEAINVKSGSVVAAGDDLVRLDAAQVAADLSAARARLLAEQVRLRELLAGADRNSLAVTESSVSAAMTALENAKRNLAEVTTQQNQLVVNAKKTLRSSGLAANLVSGEREDSNYSYTAPTISGTYDSDEEGIYRIEVFSSGAPSGASYRVTGLESGTEPVSSINPTPIGTRGLYIQFPDNFAKRTKWEIVIPNTRSSSYLANLNAYNAVVDGRNLAIAGAESAVAAAEAALTQSQSQLNQIASSARPERVEAQLALVKQMQSAVTSAEVTYDSMTLKAPFAGTVTGVKAEVGQIVSPTVPVLSFISNNNYELTVDISEVDIEHLSVDDPATVTFDAYDDALFKAHVISIAPNATLVDGVRVFEVTLVFDEEDDRVRDGLSVDINITTESRENVIAVPTRAIYEDKDGKYVRVVSDNDKVSLVRIVTGLRGSDGKSEVLSGLSGGETIITFASEEAIAQIEDYQP